MMYSIAAPLTRISLLQSVIFGRSFSYAHTRPLAARETARMRVSGSFGNSGAARARTLRFVRSPCRDGVARFKGRIYSVCAFAEDEKGVRAGGRTGEKGGWNFMHGRAGAWTMAWNPR